MPSRYCCSVVVECLHNYYSQLLVLLARPPLGSVPAPAAGEAACRITPANSHPLVCAVVPRWSSRYFAFLLIFHLENHEGGGRSIEGDVAGSNPARDPYKLTGREIREHTRNDIMHHHCTVKKSCELSVCVCVCITY